MIWMVYNGKTEWELRYNIAFLRFAFLLAFIENFKLYLYLQWFSGKMRWYFAWHTPPPPSSVSKLVAQKAYLKHHQKYVK